MEWDGAQDSLDVWIEKFADMVHRQQMSLEAVTTREKVAARVELALQMVGAAYANKAFNAQAGSTPANPSDWSTNEEALKCMINSVYSRPAFVAQHFLSKAYANRLLDLAKTLYYSVNCGSLVDLVSDTGRSALVLDLLKLIAVLVNDMKWTKEAEDAKPEIYATVHQYAGICWIQVFVIMVFNFACLWGKCRRLGELLLSILRASHPTISRLDSELLGIKNKVMEVFMCLPAYLLTAFIETEHHHAKQHQNAEEERNDGNDLILPAPILGVLLQHLHTMLLATRVEKTSDISKVLPTLIVCHNLTLTAKPQIMASFKNAIFPRSSPRTIEPSAQTNSVCPGFKDYEAVFYFKHLTFFLTCLDSDVRRYTGEWLYLLCDQNGMCSIASGMKHQNPDGTMHLQTCDGSFVPLYAAADEYTKRTGLGNAIGMLRIKGLA